MEDLCVGETFGDDQTPARKSKLPQQPAGPGMRTKGGQKWLEIGRQHFGITGPLKEANHQERIALAWALHRKTNQSQAWTAEALGLCSAANVSQQVR
jgi:hypothetical protein